MAKKKQKWWEVVVDDEEKRVFVGFDGKGGLARKTQPQDYRWRSLDHLAADARLPQERTEQILNKYIKAGLVLRNDKGDRYGYWERVAPHLAQPPAYGVVEADQNSRMDKAAQK
jgi:hypothetical protein